MTAHPSLEITLKVPDKRSYGTRSFSTLVFNTRNPPEFCVIPKNEWRTNGAESASFHSGAPTPKRMAQNASLSLSDVATMTQRHSLWGESGSPLRVEEGLEKPFQNAPKKTLQESLLLAREIISELASELAVLDSRLAPVRDEERGLRDQVLATHGECNGVVILNLDRAGDRAPLFARLSEIARKWGPTKAQRGNVNRRIKALECEAAQLEKAIIAERQKQMKA